MLKLNDYLIPEKWISWRKDIDNHPIFGDECDLGEDWSVILRDRVDSIKRILISGMVCKAGISFGKDSNCVLLLILLAHMELKAEGFTPKKPTFIMHTDTRVEMPEISVYAKKSWEWLANFICAYDLNIRLVWAEPLFSSSFLGRVVSGRGLPTTVASTARQCAQELKIGPAKVAANKAFKACGLKQNKETVVLLLGSRDEEGVARSTSISKHGGSNDPGEISIDEKSGDYMLYIIKDFTTAMVWELLTCAGNDNKLIPSFAADYSECIRIYADSAGECVMFDTAKKNAEQSKGCGARHGCWTCQVNGERDKSMEKLLQTGDYDHLRLLNRIRDYIAKRHWDWSERTAVNRSFNDYGYVKVQPDLYSFQKCKRILHGMITADMLEKERAYHAELALYNGEVEDNEKNRRMANVQFQQVKVEDLLKIEFLWSLHSFADKPWSALKIWVDVYEHDILETFNDVDEMEYVKRTPQPQAHYLFGDGDWTDGNRNLGLRDFALEAALFEPEDAIQYKTQKGAGGELITHAVMKVTEADSLSIDEAAADWIVNDPDFYLRNRDGYNPTHSAMQLLRMGCLSISKGAVMQYHRMATRQQFYRARNIQGSVSYQELLKRDDLGIIDEATFRKEVESIEAAMVSTKGKTCQSASEPEPLSEVLKEMPIWEQPMLF